MSKRIANYKFQDSLTSLRSLIFLNIFLLFCLLAPNFVRLNFGFHETILLVQILALSAFYRYGPLKTKQAIIYALVLYAVSTSYEVYYWVVGLDGIIKGALRGSKGSLFAFLFESPPYIYPVIRLASILLFLPIIRLFPSDVWDK